ncbi:hypothetical protein CONPUDRAFT_143545 [Coniophora puteana RWD-64-598 SS2]|uniref:Uncharacterized protein n=1 Tax=Coniophora puteana (strain RWD-64-598) TaxID=741705 RepID=A0A5M3MTF5_CONPW|nr:uncharacterized protein CONPUDRAFT_143545 [Coniophora puteana RWD-64-598 SS2]EIW81945.1 hypothetical protein CONPUDRAFT_143545 [Coniophora puteana RWD-64-598 SS2]
MFFFAFAVPFVIMSYATFFSDIVLRFRYPAEYALWALDAPPPYEPHPLEALTSGVWHAIEPASERPPEFVLKRHVYLDYGEALDIVLDALEVGYDGGKYCNGSGKGNGNGNGTSSSVGGFGARDGSGSGAEFWYNGSTSSGDGSSEQVGFSPLSAAPATSEAALRQQPTATARPLPRLPINDPSSSSASNDEGDNDGGESAELTVFCQCNAPSPEPMFSLVGMYGAGRRGVKAAKVFTRETWQMLKLRTTTKAEELVQALIRMDVLMVFVVASVVAAVSACAAHQENVFGAGWFKVYETEVAGEPDWVLLATGTVDASLDHQVDEPLDIQIGEDVLDVPVDDMSFGTTWKLYLGDNAPITYDAQQPPSPIVYVDAISINSASEVSALLDTEPELQGSTDTPEPRSIACVDAISIDSALEVSALLNTEPELPESADTPKPHTVFADPSTDAVYLTLAMSPGKGTRAVELGAVEIVEAEGDADMERKRDEEAAALIAEFDRIFGDVEFKGADREVQDVGDTSEGLEFFTIDYAEWHGLCDDQGVAYQDIEHPAVQLGEEIALAGESTVEDDACEQADTPDDNEECNGDGHEAAAGLKRSEPRVPEPTHISGYPFHSDKLEVAERIGDGDCQGGTDSTHCIRPSGTEPELAQLFDDDWVARFMAADLPVEGGEEKEIDEGPTDFQKAFGALHDAQWNPKLATSEFAPAFNARPTPPRDPFGVVSVSILAQAPVDAAEPGSAPRRADKGKAAARTQKKQKPASKSERADSLADSMHAPKATTKFAIYHDGAAATPVASRTRQQRALRQSAEQAAATLADSMHAPQASSPVAQHDEQAGPSTRSRTKRAAALKRAVEDISNQPGKHAREVRLEDEEFGAGASASRASSSRGPRSVPVDRVYESDAEDDYDEEDCYGEGEGQDENRPQAGAGMRGKVFPDVLSTSRKAVKRRRVRKQRAIRRATQREVSAEVVLRRRSWWHNSLTRSLAIVWYIIL